jgi:hypothetical protein
MVLQVAIAVLCRHYFHLVSPLDYTNDILVDSGITARIDSPISILACFYHESPSAGPYFSNRLLISTLSVGKLLAACLHSFTYRVGSNSAVSSWYRGHHRWLQHWFLLSFSSRLITEFALMPSMSCRTFALDSLEYRPKGARRVHDIF